VTVQEVPAGRLAIVARACRRKNAAASVRYPSAVPTLMFMAPCQSEMSVTESFTQYSIPTEMDGILYYQVRDNAQAILLYIEWNSRLARANDTSGWHGQSREFRSVLSPAGDQLDLAQPFGRRYPQPECSRQDAEARGCAVPAKLRQQRRLFEVAVSSRRGQAKSSLPSTPARWRACNATALGIARSHDAPLRSMLAVPDTKYQVVLGVPQSSRGRKTNHSPDLTMDAGLSHRWWLCRSTTAYKSMARVPLPRGAWILCWRKSEPDPRLQEPSAALVEGLVVAIDVPQWIQVRTTWKSSVPDR